MADERRKAPRDAKFILLSILYIIASLFFLLTSGCSFVFLFLMGRDWLIPLMILVPSVLLLVLILRGWRSFYWRSTYWKNVREKEDDSK